MDKTVLDKLKEIEEAEYLRLGEELYFESNQANFRMTFDVYIGEDNTPIFKVEKHTRYSDGKLIWVHIQDLKSNVHYADGV